MKKVIITGAAGGVGKAIIRRCLKDGYAVIALDSNEKALTLLAEEHPEIEAYCLDVSHFKGVEKLFQEIKKGEQLCALINSAGIYSTKPLPEYTEAEIEQLLGVNLKGAVYCTKFFIHHLQKNESGRIINIVSVSGQENRSDTIHGMTKAALLGLTRSTAVNVPPNIMVNAIDPTMIETEMIKRIPDWRKREYARKHLLELPHPSEDIAEAVSYLLSEAGSSYTGTAFELSEEGHLF